MASVYSVKQINSYIKYMFSQDFALGKVYVKGEVSNCKYHTSGHIYFTLKDESGVLACVMFAGNRAGLKFRLEEGQRVIAFGAINVYEKDGKYQLYTKEIALDGDGQLYQQFELLKKQLEETGLFDKAYKQDIPEFCERIGIVTAASGAAIQDICNIARRRNPFVKLFLYNALVQGQGAADSIVEGIRTLDAMNLDVLIVGRGGGSMEDLWAFNEEKVAYSVFHCRTPLISAVGHETDYTIIDFVADHRAPTPSAAAEIAVFEYSKFLERIAEQEYRLRMNMNHVLDRCKNRLQRDMLALRIRSPKAKLQVKQQYLDDLQQHMQNILNNKLQKNKHRLALDVQKLDGLSPLKRFEKGFVFAADKEKRPVSSIKQLQKGDIVEIFLKDGSVETEVTNIMSAPDIIS
ncbi:MAG: exodeoxyribonuclease VII large subunit [Lachnospiraceae bacterium]|nr:exodeoxyribonuclease VII large subunit [Lachnospiraceae bacterium]